jgi:hypothetical protein
MKSEIFNLELTKEEVKMLTEGMRQWAMLLQKSIDEIQQTNPDHHAPEKVIELLVNVNKVRDEMGQLVGVSFWGKER